MVQLLRSENYLMNIHFGYVSSSCVYFFFFFVFGCIFWMSSNSFFVIRRRSKKKKTTNKALSKRDKKKTKEFCLLTFCSRLKHPMNWNGELLLSLKSRMIALTARSHVFPLFVFFFFLVHNTHTHTERSIFSLRKFIFFFRL